MNSAESHLENQEITKRFILYTSSVKRYTFVSIHLYQRDICLPTFWGPDPRKFGGNARVYPEKSGQPPTFLFLPLFGNPKSQKIISIRFFKDLCLARCWALKNNKIIIMLKNLYLCLGQCWALEKSHNTKSKVNTLTLFNV